MMRYDEFMPFAPDYAGQVRANHSSSGCSGGRDSMRITRDTDGTVRSKCYRCGEWGIWSPQFKAANKVLNRFKTNEEAVREFKLPTDLSSDTSKWSVEARVFILRAITEEEVKMYGIMYSPTKDILLLPIDKDNFYVRLFSNPVMKYISVCKTKDVYKYTNKGSKIVIVEDYLSFIKVSRHYSCLCIFGTTLTPVHTSIIMNSHKDVVIFLDNDNETVRRKQREMHDSLSLLGKCRIIKHDKDPKYCTDEELKRIIG
jgi:hypothetical protein